jgi:mannose-6-phosphate isomerase-like protein (cupin superfamily)
LGRQKERWRVVADSYAGTVTAMDVADAEGTVYRMHFITMDPGALSLPVQLHADMVFYVHSGRCHAYVIYAYCPYQS